MRHDEYVAQREATDPEFAAARADLRPQVELARAMIGARIATGLTQAQLAARLGRKQPVIARLESGAHPPRLDTLMDLADAAGGEFVIGPGRTIIFRPKAGRARLAQVPGRTAHGQGVRVRAASTLRDPRGHGQTRSSSGARRSRVDSKN